MTPRRPHRGVAPAPECPGTRPRGRLALEPPGRHSLAEPSFAGPSNLGTREEDRRLPRRPTARRRRRPARPARRRSLPLAGRPGRRTHRRLVARPGRTGLGSARRAARPRRTGRPHARPARRGLGGRAPVAGGSAVLDAPGARAGTRGRARTRLVRRRARGDRPYGDRPLRPHHARRLAARPGGQAAGLPGLRGRRRALGAARHRRHHRPRGGGADRPVPLLVGGVAARRGRVRLRPDGRPTTRCPRASRPSTAACGGTASARRPARTG